MLTVKDIEIKPLNRGDLTFVNSTRNYISTRSNLENEKEISLDDTYAWFENKKPSWYLILKKSEKVGYIRTSDDTGKSICIGCDIHPNHRRKGIAKNSYNAFISHLYEKKYVNIWLEVFEDNVPAVSLYKKLGFVTLGSRIVRDKNYLMMVHKRFVESEKKD